MKTAINILDWTPTDGGYGEFYSRVVQHLKSHAGMPQGDEVLGYSPDLLAEIHEEWHGADRSAFFGNGIEVE